MIKVKDIDGKEVRGLYRGSLGSLIVNDSELMQKYLVEKNAREKDKHRIATLELELNELRTMVEQLLRKQQ
jgi:hypothetical protein